MRLELPNSIGIYSLILELKYNKVMNIGALGNISFNSGYYSYTGSARGTGGFSRVKRHLRVAAHQNHTKRWHIDYLLPHTKPKNVILTCTDQDFECSISNTIGQYTETIKGFGCSDCRCSGHLHRGQDLTQLINIVTDAHNIKGTIHKLYSI